jgi:membrane protein DedA with SNARE-associated domain
MKPSQPYSLTRLSCLLRGLGLGFVIGITLLITLYRDRLQDFAALGYGGAFLAMLASNATLILPAPGLIIVFALGSSLNPVLVGLAGAAGATLGELTGYITGFSGLVVLENTSVAYRVRYWMNRNGPLTIFALSVVPNPFFDLAGLMAGAGRMPVWRFLLVAFSGKTIQATAIALAGALSLTWIEPWLTH